MDGANGIADVCFVSIFCSLDELQRCSSCKDAGGMRTEVKFGGKSSDGGREKWLGSLAMR